MIPQAVVEMPRDLPPDSQPLVLPDDDEPYRLGLPPESVLPRNDLALCLPVLLRTLGWAGDTRHLTEALPYFGGPLDLTALRRVMADLGYRSQIRRSKLHNLADIEVPCLFLPKGRSACVVIERRDKALSLFTPRGLQRGRPPRARGQAIVFTSIVDPEQALVPTGQTSWLLGILRRFTGHLWLALFLSTVIALLSTAGSLYVMAVYDRAVGAGSSITLVSLIIGVTLAVGGEMVMRSLRSALLARVGARIDVLVGRSVFERLMRLPPALTEGSTVGAQLARVKDFETVREFLVGPMAGSVLDVPFSVLIIGLVYLLAGPLGLVPTIAALALVVLGLVARSGLRRRVGESARSVAARQDLALEALTHHRLLRTTGSIATWLARYRVRAINAARATHATNSYIGLLGVIAQALVVSSGVATLWFGASLVMAGGLSVGGLIASMILLWRALAPFQSSFMVLARSEQVRSSVRQIDRLMELVPEQADRATVRPVRGVRGAVGVTRFSMRYGPDSEPALLGVSLEVEAGEVVAVVGANGAGKSTLIKAVAGMVRGQTGMVKVDGMDIRRFDPVEYRRAIAYAPDEATVFRGTVLQNIQLADAAATPEQVTEAARVVGLLDEADALPQGLETRLGDQSTASPSIRTRIALARVLLRRAPIVLLDEPAGGLDAAGDEALMTVIRRLKGHSTVFVVTHRPSHVRLADKILELSKGQVVRFGAVPDLKGEPRPPEASVALSTEASASESSSASGSLSMSGPEKVVAQALASPELRRGSRKPRPGAHIADMEEEPIHRHRRTVILVLVGVIGALLIWAAREPIAETAMTQGQVVPRQQVQRVQHLEGGIVAEILVEDGSKVEAGDLLVRLQPEAALGDAGQMRARRDALQRQAERLRAVAEGDSAPDFSGMSTIDAGLDAGQQALFKAQLKTLDDRRAVLEARLTQRQAEISGLIQERDAWQRRIDALRSEADMYQQLFNSGHGTKVTLLKALSDLAEAQAERERVVGRLESLEGGLTELREQLNEIVSTSREQVLDRLGQVQAELAEVDKILVRAEDRVDRLALRAPVEGIVKGLSVKAPGEVITPGQVVMEIVPTAGGLLVESRVSPRDVGALKVGQEVKIKVSAFDFARYGAIRGALESVSATTFVDENGQPFYKARVGMTQDWVGRPGNRVLPGMVVQADITTGEKTLIEYLLKPIYIAATQAFTER
ncbi:HlyD family type I secretion periplasmic adaptor subunit [Pararhodospirillum photometricum]|uniref:Membrane fusion protein (MFP) family protein n=1 Tax=Pararhodospirillum photometricum DSM 122 TaxID=1150469 RepID=H6SQ61_PARPM|nr:HlyD family type I secretion periplasmic adaptor subunit [Pararhodospirillum photometricum]CCG09580.1 Toxin secretion ATP-binding protein [Pararhodospirillum photometricum DSM 122]